MTVMRQEITERLLVGAVRQGMDQVVRDLDWQTQARLTRLRLQALEQQPHHLSTGFDFSSFSRGFAVATAVTLAITLWVLPNAMEPVPGTLSMLNDRFAEPADTAVDVTAMDVLMSNEEMDFLEDLEMYEWLEAEYG